MANVGVILAQMLDATFIQQTYSRLVVDCNRAPGAPDAIAPVSDGTAIPANLNMTAAEAGQRYALIHEPYQQAIGEELAARDAEQRGTILIALHSFTPQLGGGNARPWQIGILHDAGDASFAIAMLEVLGRDERFTVGDNEPYRMDRIDYTVPRHAYPLRRRYAELEIRQDLIATADGQSEWASRLASALSTVIDEGGAAISREPVGTR